MKKRALKFLLFSFIFLLFSCVKTQHSLRITNEASVALHIIVGSESYGLISPGKTTSYKNITEGTNQVGGDLKGSITVSGKGKHQWTLIINSNGTYELISDK